MDVEGWHDVFANPNAWVGVSFETPAWVGSLRRAQSAGPSTPEAESFTLDREEMPPGMARAWGRDGGWAAFGTRIKAVAQVLGGTAELQTYRSHGYGTERHEVRYVGPKVEDL